jgi:hypothetical protein
MEQDTRLTKAMAYLKSALDSLSYAEYPSKFQIKSSNTSIRNAITLIRNCRVDDRIFKIENDVSLLKEIVLSLKEGDKK